MATPARNPVKGNGIKNRKYEHCQKISCNIPPLFLYSETEITFLSFSTSKALF
jgi:hypothetical protein